MENNGSYDLLSLLTFIDWDDFGKLILLSLSLSLFVASIALLQDPTERHSMSSIYSKGAVWPSIYYILRK